MKNRLVEFFILTVIATTFYACNNDEILKKVKENSDVIKENSEKLNTLVDGNEVDILKNAVILNVSLKKEHNNDWQVIHIEGEYRMPYIVMAKFKTDFNRRKCLIKEIDLKVFSLLENKKFGFSKNPEIKRDTDGMLKLYAEIEETTIAANLRRKIQGLSLNALHNEIMDMKIKNSKELQTYFTEDKGYNGGDIMIKCCGGAICKVRLDTGG